MKIKDRSISWLYFLVLILFAVVFAKERIINSDAAFYLFKLIHFGGFNIEHERYSAFISQLLIIPFIKAGFNLKSLVYLYSISFVVLFFCVFLLIKRGLKDQQSALALIFLLIVGLAHPMYRPVSESTQGLVYSLMLPGILMLRFPSLSKIKESIIKYIGAIIVITLCYFSHPITIFPLLFILAFYYIDGKKYKEPLVYLIFLSILIIFASKLLLNSTSSYEEDKLMNIATIKDNLFNFFHLYPTRFYIKRIPYTYLIPTIILLALNIYYFKRKKVLKLILLDSACLAFFFIHNIIYNAGGSDLELEKNYMTLNFFLFYAFFHDMYPEIKNNNYRLLLTFVSLIFSVFIILKPSDIYKGRIDYLQEMNKSLQNTKGDKFYTETENIDNEKILFMWGVPFETLLYSSLEGPEQSKTIFPFENLNNLPDYLENPDLFMCVFFWPRWNVNDLNDKYFRLSSEKYQYTDFKDVTQN